MGKKTLLMLGGIALGVLALFAVIGIQSTFTRTADTTNNTQVTTETPPPAPAGIIKGLPEDGDVVSTLDAPADEDSGQLEIELVDEPDMPGLDDPVLANQDDPALDDGAVPGQREPDLQAQAEQQPSPMPTATTGMLEIMVQSAGSGKPVRANVYVQRPNGVNVDQQNYTSKAAFALKPGTYKITARANGYGSLVRNITVQSGAVANEIFPLPPLHARTTPTPTAPPATPQQTPPQPVAPAAADGRLRVAVLSADDGRPLRVNFTISRPDGRVVETINDTSLSELSLPPQEYLVSFNYQGFQGSKLLNVQPGSTVSHTFNIRGVPIPTPAPVQEPPLPNNIQPPPPAQQEPQSIENMLLDRLKDELLKRRE